MSSSQMVEWYEIRISSILGSIPIRLNTFLCKQMVFYLLYWFPFLFLFNIWPPLILFLSSFNFFFFHLPSPVDPFSMHCLAKSKNVWIFLNHLLIVYLCLDEAISHLQAVVDSFIVCMCVVCVHCVCTVCILCVLLGWWSGMVIVTWQYQWDMERRRKRGRESNALDILLNIYVNTLLFFWFVRTIASVDECFFSGIGTLD